MRIDAHSWFSLALVTAWAGCGGATSNDSAGSSSSKDAGTITSGDDAGADTDGASGDDAATDTPTVCTSNQTWTRGDHGSALMHPGGACITCHSTNDGPTLTIAGTVYPTAHEPDDCNGASGTIQIVITDANAKVTTLTTNAAGNFYGTGAIAKPFQAKVVSGGKERAMTAAQTSGDCNSCHTVDGTNSAPGRIMAP